MFNNVMAHMSRFATTVTSFRKRLIGADRAKKRNAAIGLVLLVCILGLFSHLACSRNAGEGSTKPLEPAKEADASSPEPVLSPDQARIASGNAMLQACGYTDVPDCSKLSTHKSQFVPESTKTKKVGVLHCAGKFQKSDDTLDVCDCTCTPP